MLCDAEIIRPTEFDESIYCFVVPSDHFLRKVLEIVPWALLVERIKGFYCPDMGRPAMPMLMLKLQYLRYHYNLSDRDVIARAETDLAFRFFLRLPLRGGLPHPSSLCVFRGRLGVDGFREIFDEIVRVARQHGIVKDRLRLKDATHVVANITSQTDLALLVQTRDKLLAAAEPYEPEMVEGERVNLEMLREATKSHKPNEKLATRTVQLREMLYWVDEVQSPDNAGSDPAWEAFVVQRTLAHRILDEQQQRSGGDYVLSTVDPDARRAKHGQWFNGYLTDLLVDPDSEIITAVNVISAIGDEAIDAVELVRQEEATHENDIQAISMDGRGFNGPVLRELEDPEGLNVETFVPPPADDSSGLFTPRDFEEDKERGVVTCPAGKTSQAGFRDNAKQSTKYRFSASVCRDCPLLNRCMKHPPKKMGRTVCKSDYQEEHARVRQKATTPEYQAVRREHFKVERKLGEVMNRHGGRRAHYHGNAKTLIQQLMACTATNVKRIVRLVASPTVEMA